MNIRSTEKRPASPGFEDMRGCVKAWTRTRMKSVLPLRTLSFRQRNNGLNSLSPSENELVTHTGSPPKTFVGERDSFAFAFSYVGARFIASALFSTTGAMNCAPTPSPNRLVSRKGAACCTPTTRITLHVSRISTYGEIVNDHA
jgi:hypothetical protein